MTTPLYPPAVVTHHTTVQVIYIPSIITNWENQNPRAPKNEFSKMLPESQQKLVNVAAGALSKSTYLSKSGIKLINRNWCQVHLNYLQ